MAFKCPNCSVLIDVTFCKISEPSNRYGISFNNTYDDPSRTHNWTIFSSQCLSCNIPIIKVKNVSYIEDGGKKFNESEEEFIIYPNKKLDINLPVEIPENYRNYFKEAYSVLNFSPAASAALSRRILQLLLVEKAGVTNKGNLAKMIDELIASGKLPSYLADGIEKVKEIGNYAVHPNKSTNSNEIIDVEPGEAEWCLDILEGLFDFYFVQPIKAQKRRDEWDKKIKGNK